MVISVWSMKYNDKRYKNISERCNIAYFRDLNGAMYDTTRWPTKLIIVNRDELSFLLFTLK